MTVTRIHYLLLLAGAVGCVQAAAETARARAGGSTPTHTRPRALAVDARRELLYVALSTANRVAVVDVARGGARILAQVPVCSFPDALAALPTGGVVVSCRFDPSLRIVTPPASEGARFAVRVVDAGPEHGHQGVAVDPSGTFAYVGSPARGGVKIVGLRTGAEPQRFLPTGLSPRRLRVFTPPTQTAPAPADSSALLLVSNFIGHTVTLHRIEADGGLSGALQTITTEAPVLDLGIVSADGLERQQTLWLLTHEDRPLSRANLAVEGLDSVVLTLAAATAGKGPPFIDPGAGNRRTLNLTERAGGGLVGLDALAVDATTGQVAIVGAGSDNVLVASSAPESLTAASTAAVGAHPSAVAFLPGGRVATADHLSDTLSFVHPVQAAEDAACPEEGPRKPQRVDTLIVGNPERRTDVDRGEILFYSRALVPHNVATGPLSVYTCAACHVDGQIDGRRHPSKRNRFYSMTKSCRGLRGTEPFLSLGKPSTFAAFADNIVATHAQGALDAPDTFDRYPVTLRLWQRAGWTSATLSPDSVRAALAAYMAAIPTEPSPYVAVGRRDFSEAERRGLEIFRDNCAGCHQLSRSTADTRPVVRESLAARLLAGELALTSARLYDVGTPVLGQGGNNPPSLRNVWSAAPYFSDGSAPTLEAVLARTDPNAPKVHAPENAERSSPLSAEDAAALLAFLRAL